jgi:hypothetical protein
MPLVEISYRLEQVSRQWRLKLKSQLDFWVKENERTIAYVQSYRMENSFSNPVYVDDTLLASSDVNLLYVKKFEMSLFGFGNWVTTLGGLIVFNEKYTGD